MARKVAHKAVHKTIHKTVHKTIHKTVHKVAHKPVRKKAAIRKVGLVVPKAMLLNDCLNTCALLAWWNACVFQFGQCVPTPDDELVARVYASMGGDSDAGLYLEDVLERATSGLFGYRLTDENDPYGIPIGTAGDHAYGGREALDTDMDDLWFVSIAPL